MEPIDFLTANLQDPQWLKSLHSKHPSDIAEQIRILPVTKIREILRQLPDELAAEIISSLPEDIAIQIFETMRVQRLSGIVGEMFTDDAADVIGQLSASRLKQIMDSLHPENADDIRSLLTYPEDSAGGIMQTEFVAMRESITITQATEELRTIEPEEHTQLFYIYVIDDSEHLRGVLRVRDLLFNPADTLLKDIMDPEVRCVHTLADQEEIAMLFQRYRFTSVPVVDEYQKLCGIITADDALEVIQEEATEDMQRMIGLSGEEMAETPWKESVSKRLPWLIVNLFTAFLAGYVISCFENTIAQVATLAVFLPIIAGQSGNSGTQTLTILVRSLALGEMPFSEQKKVFLKEVFVSLATGLSIGLLVGIVGWLWKDNLALGIIACLAMLLNTICAALAGVIIPLGLKTLKIDPALASAIMLTTVTDVVGFLIFLSLAQIGITYAYL